MLYQHSTAQRILEKASESNECDKVSHEPQWEINYSAVRINTAIN